MLLCTVVNKSIKILFSLVGVYVLMTYGFLFLFHDTSHKGASREGCKKQLSDPYRFQIHHDTHSASLNKKLENSGRRSLTTPHLARENIQKIMMILIIVFLGAILSFISDNVGQSRSLPKHNNESIRKKYGKW